MTVVAHTKSLGVCTNPSVIEWIEEQVKKVRPLDKIMWEEFFPSGERYKAEWYLKKDKQAEEKHITPENIAMWIFQQLCYQGWEPLDSGKLRLEVEKA